MERCEERTLLATFVVNSTADYDDASLDGICETDSGNGVCTLRAAIQESNADSSFDTIEFDIPEAGVQIIRPSSALPTIAHPVLIDGYVQPGASPNTNAMTDPDPSDNAVLLIELDGSDAGDVGGLTVAGGNTTIRGLAIHSFPTAISLPSAGNVVAGNFIGTDASGLSAPGGQVFGIRVGCDYNVIGGVTADARNVISGGEDTEPGDWTGHGVHFSGGWENRNHPCQSGAVVQGNFIGIDVTGTRSFGNSSSGIFVTGVGGLLIGGTEAGARNIISGNATSGIYFETTSNSVVQGNFIGTDVTGTVSLPNHEQGVYIGSQDVTIGGTQSGARNIISGNDGRGISVFGINHHIQGNFIGTDVTGTQALGNGTGIFNYFTEDVTIGGSAAGAGNLISGNKDVGIVLWSSQNDVIQGNLIGTDVTGSVAIDGNEGVGPLIDVHRAHHILIGGTADAARNVISGGTADGILIDAEAHDNTVHGNYIGTDITGTKPLANQLNGVAVYGFNNTIGGIGNGEGNVIAFNADCGIRVIGKTGNSIRGNAIFGNRFREILLNAGNNLQSPPTIESVYHSELGTTVRGTMSGSANTTFLLDFYGSRHVPDDGEAERYVGSAQITTGSSGSFEVTVNPGIEIGEVLTATATDAGNNTSELSYWTIPAVPLGTAKTIVVDNSNDDGEGSLRQAILDANHNGGNATIAFELLTTDSHYDPETGRFTISPATPFVPLLYATFIDGHSQAGSSANTHAMGDTEHPDDDAVLPVYLNGDLKIIGGDSTVTGLMIDSITIDGGDHNTIAGNYVGTDGKDAFSASTPGIVIRNSSDNTIGGTTEGARNVIAGQIALHATAHHNTVLGNYIGLKADGTQSVETPWVWAGILIRGPFNTIGGTTTAARNVLAGSYDFQINIYEVAGTTIEGNYVGTNARGDGPTGALSGTGIHSELSSDTVISNNVISGHLGCAVSIWSDSGDLIQANKIGTDVTGTQPIGNGCGLQMGSSSVSVGGLDEGEGNLIAFNGSNAISVSIGGPDRSPQILGNTIHDNGYGTDVYCYYAVRCPAVMVGGSHVVLKENSIFDNAQAGVWIGWSMITDVQVSENTIYGNDGPGVWVLGSDFDLEYGPYTSGVEISRNSIYGNSGLGIALGGTAVEQDGVTPAADSAHWYDSIPPVAPLANDSADADEGPNGFQNSPTVAAATAGTSTVVAGDLRDLANGTYSIDFYASESTSFGGDGIAEGHRYLGSAVVTKDASNSNGGFTATGLEETVVGEYITANATASNGSTSEFSGAWHVVDLAIDGTGDGNTFVVSPGSGGTTEVIIDGVTQYYSIPGTLSLLGGDGADSYTVNFGDGLPSRILVPDNGTTGSDTITFNGTATDETLNKTEGTVQWRLLGDPAYRVRADFSGIEGGTINAAAGNDTIIDPGVTNFLILGGPGDDTILIDSIAGTGVTVDGGQDSDTVIVELGNLLAVVSVIDTGTTGSDSVIVNGTADDDVLDVTPTQLTHDAETVKFSPAIEHLTVATGAGNDSVSVTATSAPGITVDGQNGSDSFVVYLGGLAGPVTIADSGTAGSDAVRVNGTADDDAIALTVGQVQSGTQSITLSSAVAALNVDAGAGNDSVSVSEFTAPVASLAIGGSSGSDVFTVTDLGSQVESLTVDGGGGDGTDQLQIQGALPASVTTSHIAPSNLLLTLASTTVNLGERAVLSGSFVDPDAADTHTVVIAWGDGTTDTVSLPTAVLGFDAVSHVYLSAGQFSATVTVRDGAGASTTATFQVNTRRSIIALDPSLCGAITLSGDASISIPGNVVVNSRCVANALAASGNASAAASSIRVVGGAQKSGNATFSPPPTTHAAVSPDPLAAMPAPLPGTLRGAVNCTGTSSQSLQPGLYTQISASGNCTLNLATGVYIIAGGGFNVSGNAAVLGSTSGVLIYNTGSNYPQPGGTFGGISLSSNGMVRLDPFTSGPYAGTLLFQATANTRPVSLSGNSTLGGIHGTVYAPTAQLTLSGNGELEASLIVGSLRMSGSTISRLATDAANASDDSPAIASAQGQLVQGVLWVAIEDAATALLADQLARVDDAINTINSQLGPYGTMVLRVDGALTDVADVRVRVEATSGCGSAADGVLGCTEHGREITILTGWNWYAGSNPTAVGAGEFDFQTVVAHELGHAMGLEHSPHAESVMRATLSSGAAARQLTDADLNVFGSDGDDGPHAVRAVLLTSVLTIDAIAPVATGTAYCRAGSDQLSAVSAGSRLSAVSRLVQCGQWSAVRGQPSLTGGSTLLCWESEQFRKLEAVARSGMGIGDSRLIDQVLEELLNEGIL